MRSTTDKAERLPAAIHPLDKEVRNNLPTAEAAQHLNVSAQTMRKWASMRCGPVAPVRVAGRLGWPVAALRKVVAGAAA